jgi:hypothetical protein
MAYTRWWWRRRRGGGGKGGNKILCMYTVVGWMCCLVGSREFLLFCCSDAGASIKVVVKWVWMARTDFRRSCPKLPFLSLHFATVRPPLVCHIMPATGFPTSIASAGICRRKMFIGGCRWMLPQIRFTWDYSVPLEPFNIFNVT